MISFELLRHQRHPKPLKKLQKDSLSDVELSVGMRHGTFDCVIGCYRIGGSPSTVEYE